MFVITFIGLIATGCKKYLEATPSKSLVIPNSVDDLQALLDANVSMNNDNYILGEASADNYYLPDNTWQSLAIDYRNTYIWGSKIASNFSNDWLTLYRQVNVANTVLDNLPKIAKTSQNSTSWDNVKGSALFFRAFCFSSVAFNWALAYDSTTAKSDLGIPLRLSSDFNIPSFRASVAETYSQIIKDLTMAASLLPKVPIHVFRPSKGAAFAQLARVYLSMNDYEHAYSYSDSCLAINNALIDYNTLNSAPGEYYSFPMFNKEVIFSYNGYNTLLDNYKAKIDSAVYNLYSANDLRKTLFFFGDDDASMAFKGNYTGSYGLFIGLATDELYLNKAECQVRLGYNMEAAKTLDKLLSMRYKTGTYLPLKVNSSDQILRIILTERRKELLMRNIRWIDIKRLNALGLGINLKRIIDETTFQLKAGSPNFALPIPQYVIQHSGMKQNAHD